MRSSVRQGQDSPCLLKWSNPGAKAPGLATVFSLTPNKSLPRVWVAKTPLLFICLRAASLLSLARWNGVFDVDLVGPDDVRRGSARRCYVFWNTTYHEKHTFGVSRQRLRSGCQGFAVNAFVTSVAYLHCRYLAGSKENFLFAEDLPIGTEIGGIKESS